LGSNPSPPQNCGGAPLTGSKFSPLSGGDGRRPEGVAKKFFKTVFSLFFQKYYYTFNNLSL